LRAFFTDRILKPILDQLKKGADPDRLSLAATMGALIGVIPVLGISTGLGVAVGAILRLNHVVLQAINYLVYPLQLLLFPVFLLLMICPKFSIKKALMKIYQSSDIKSKGQ
jgi:uncharacterized protein (DUF2062 family)